MTTNTTSKRQETDICIGDVHGLGEELMQQVNVISGGNAVGKSAMLDAMMLARERHAGCEGEGVVVHIAEVARTLAGDGNIPVHKYPRDKDIPRS